MLATVKFSADLFLWYCISQEQAGNGGETRTTEITGTIKNITFRNRETGYVVAKLDRNATLCGMNIPRHNGRP
jgi:hypothetical protein